MNPDKRTRELTERLIFNFMRGMSEHLPEVVHEILEAEAVLTIEQEEKITARLFAHLGNLSTHFVKGVTGKSLQFHVTEKMRVIAARHGVVFKELHNFHGD